MEHVSHLENFSVIELRRYTTKRGERHHFAQRFESFFPEAFEQLGAIIFGSFFERNDQSTFTWLRGFHTLDSRAVVSSAFYYGPLWKEHRSTVNDLLLDSDNVLLLQPFNADRGLTLLPAVDPVREPSGSQGLVVAQVFPVQPGSVNAFAAFAAPTFAAYRSIGALEAGLLVTLEAANNFPQLPVRTDGPFLVWFGIFKDDLTLQHRFQPLVERSLRSQITSGLLTGRPELLILDPTPRSRLRWFP
jgi:hypothetical protein